MTRRLRPVTTALKVKRIRPGWYCAIGRRYDFEFYSECGWQLMVYRSGTMQIDAQGNEGRGDCLYAVTLDKKSEAVGWAQAFDSGWEKVPVGGHERGMDEWS